MARISTGRKSGFILRGGVMRRETKWVGIAPTALSALSAGSTAALFTGLGATELALRPFTIVRTRIDFWAASDQRTATEAWQVAIGMAVVSDQALAIGITAIPTPITDLGSDLWFVHGILSGQIGLSSAVGLVTNDVSMQIDSKAMRKINDDQDFALVLETAAFNGVDVLTAGRMLIKDS